jgi:hypothetical protein
VDDRHLSVDRTGVTQAPYASIAGRRGQPDLVREDGNGCLRVDLQAFQQLPVERVEGNSLAHREPCSR